MSCPTCDENGCTCAPAIKNPVRKPIQGGLTEAEKVTAGHVIRNGILDRPYHSFQRFFRARVWRYMEKVVDAWGAPFFLAAQCAVWIWEKILIRLVVAILLAPMLILWIIAALALIVPYTIEFMKFRALAKRFQAEGSV